MSNTPSTVHNYFKLELLIGRSHITLCRLFKDRYSLSTGGQIWNDSPTCGSNYLANISRKNTKLNLTGVQKTLISSGDSNQWDLTTLTALLLNIHRPNNLSSAQIQQLNNENILLRELRDIRNTLAHHKSKSIVDSEFHQLWSKLETILIAFGDDQNDLDKLKADTVFDTTAQPINEENLKKALQLNSTGTQAHKEQKYSEAIASFTKAIVLPGVPNHERAVLYSNMSSSRLALYEQQGDSQPTFDVNHPVDQRYRALQDAKQSRTISPTWWKGHFRVGQVYAVLNEHEKAINSFGRALALAPGNTEIQKALGDSQLIHGRQTRQEHLDPRLAPRTLPEHLNELNHNLGIDPEKVRLAHSLLDKVDPSAADVVKGHKYEHGDIDVKQDYEQAAKYFAKAARQENAEGIYNLARLYDRGFGVKKDHDMAFKLLQQAAALPFEHPKLKNLPNVGVAEAQHSLGLRYYEGVVVHKNLSIAAYWYQLATDHGSAESANNLALMYEYGTGVDKDLDKAEQLYELSASRRDTNAMKNLAELLVDKNNLEMAKIWYDRACDAGNGLAQINREKFYSTLHRKQSSQANDSFDRLQRTNKFDQVCNPSGSIDTVNTDSDMCDYNSLHEYAERGSVTAQKMCRAQMHFLQALDILMEPEPLTETQENEFIHELAQCYCIERIVAKIPAIEMHHQVERVIDRVLQRCNNGPNAFDSQLDEDVRTCYATLHMDSHQLIVQFLRICKEKYPRSVYFFDLSAHLNHSLNNHQVSLYDINIGLELDASHCELLYQKAMALTVLNEDINKIIEAYQTFLAVAPNDHPEVPESYYAMAMCYLIRDRSSEPTDIPKNTYEQGQEAEKLQLPNFLPYQSPSKMVVKGLIDKECASKSVSIPSNNRKLRLTNPRRIEIIKGHRQWAVSMSQMRGNATHSMIRSTIKPPATQQMATSLVGLKSITLKEMNPTKDHIYKGYVISLTITEEIHCWSPSIHLIVEDENLDCEQMCIYNFPAGQGEYLVTEVFKIGHKMNVINPYLRIGAYDGKPMIRVDDFSSIIIQGESERVINMCRCCGEPNALHGCSQCANARYCSKECQTMDWKFYGHKIICNKQ